MPVFFREVPLFTGRSSPNLARTSGRGANEKRRGLGGLAPHRGDGGGPQSRKIGIFGTISGLVPKRLLGAEREPYQRVAMTFMRPAPPPRPFLSFREKCYGGLKMGKIDFLAKMAKFEVPLPSKVPLIGDRSSSVIPPWNQQLGDDRIPKSSRIGSIGTDQDRSENPDFRIFSEKI